MGNQDLVKQGFLWGLAVIYLFAFTSLYIQIPGLYGDKGLLPASYVLKDISACRDKHPECIRWVLKGECERNTGWMTVNCRKSCKRCQDSSLTSLIKTKPTLLWLMPWLGLDTATGMELLCLTGIVLSMVLLISQRCRDCINYFVLWMLYYSLFQVGQKFLWYQWDGLLLETGFLSIIVAPWNIKLLPWKWKLYKCKRIRDMVRQHDAISLWLIKWLLFRLMFASGVVKLSYMDPTWWNLTAMYWHYESQCIPTPVAWYFQKFPKWFHRLSTVVTYVIEIGLPFLFFVPVRSIRIFAYCGQVLLQLLILLTGNYNFFNLLTIVLCISLLDDQVITTSYRCQSSCTKSCKKTKSKSLDCEGNVNKQHGDTEELDGDIVIDCQPMSDQATCEESTSQNSAFKDKTSKEEKLPSSTTQQILEIIFAHIQSRYNAVLAQNIQEFLNSKKAGTLKTLLKVVVFFGTMAGLVYLVQRWFYFEYVDGKLMSWIAFSPADFTLFVTKTTNAAMWIGLISLLIEIVGTFLR